MSSATARLVLDNRVNVSHEFDELIKYSGVNVNDFEITPDGSVFTNQILFQNIVTPNLATTLVSRNMRLRYDVSLTYDSTAAQTPHFSGVIDNFYPAQAPTIGYDINQFVDTALRAPYALQSCCDSVSLTINSGTTTINSRQVLDPLMRRVPDEYLRNQSSEAPSMLDNRAVLLSDGIMLGKQPTVAIGAYANWAAVVAAGAINFNVPIGGVNVPYIYSPTGAAPPAVGTYVSITELHSTSTVQQVSFIAVQTLWVAAGIASLGTAYVYKQSDVSGQPLSKLENSMCACTRGSFKPNAVSANGNNITVTFSVSEQIVISPLTLMDNDNYLANVNTLNLLLNFSNLNDMFVTANPNLPALVATNVVIGNPRLQLRYIQVNPQVVSIPRVVSYNYENVVYFSKTFTQNIGAYPAASQWQLQSDTIRLQAMPALIYILARQFIQNRSNQATQTFYGLGPAVQTGGTQAQLSINIGNRTGLLASASIQTLYRMSKANGYSGSFNDWQTSGCVIILNPVKDLGVDPSLDGLPLETFSTNFQVSGYWNANPQNYAGIYGQAGIPVELLLVCVYAGVSSISTDQCAFSLGALTSNEIRQVVNNSGKDGSMLSSEHVTPTIQGKGLFTNDKAVLGKMASSVQAPMGAGSMGYFAGKM